jgi:cytochrome c oxidase assembly protein subunit 11
MSLRAELNLSRNFSSSIARSEAAESTSTAQLRERVEQQRREAYRRRNQSLLMYTAAAFAVGVGFTYAAVPLYRAFCSATGFSGTPMVGLGKFEPAKLFPQYFDPATRSATKRIRISFNADHSEALPWTFKPSQEEIYVLPGETALAFYKAKNKGNQDLTGIATYNVSPDRIAPYFAKIECFCFEEQKLLANEEVDLPVFFFIDKDVLDDPTVRDVKDVVLSYSFFGARRNTVTGQLEPDTDLEKVSLLLDVYAIDVAVMLIYLRPSILSARTYEQCTSSSTVQPHICIIHNICNLPATSHTQIVC